MVYIGDVKFDSNTLDSTKNNYLGRSIRESHEYRGYGRLPWKFAGDETN
jgi:hypothetical protein